MKLLRSSWNWQWRVYASPGPFLLIGIDILYRSFTSKATVLLMVTEAHFEKVECVSSIETGVVRKQVLSRFLNNAILKACVTYSLSDTSSSEKRKLKKYRSSCFGIKNGYKDYQSLQK